MNRPTHVILHCSDSPFGDRKVIDGWHKQRGFACVGYHYVVLNGRRVSVKFYHSIDDGLVEAGRPEKVIGAHCLEYNYRSIGVCMIGRGVYTDAQLRATVKLVNEIREHYKIPIENVLGHCETASGKAEGKTCPMFDMARFRQMLLTNNVTEP